MLMVREGDGYVNYYYLSDGAVDEGGAYIPGWADAGGNPLPDEGVEIEPGTAFWFVDQYNEESSLTVPGAVLADASVEKTFGLGYTLAATPYPIACGFADIKFTGITGPAYDEEGEFFETAPMTLVRVDGGYVNYYYLSDGAVDEGGKYIPGWADAGGNPLADYTEKVIPAGSAFWVNIPASAKGFKATFSL